MLSLFFNQPLFKKMFHTFSVFLFHCFFFSINIYLAGFLKTLPPNRPLSSNSYFSAIIKWRVQRYHCFFLFSSFLFLHWRCDSRASQAQGICLVWHLCTQMGANFVRLIFKQSARKKFFFLIHKHNGRSTVETSFWLFSQLTFTAKYHDCQRSSQTMRTLLKTKQSLTFFSHMDKYKITKMIRAATWPPWKKIMLAAVEGVVGGPAIVAVV